MGVETTDTTRPDLFSVREFSEKYFNGNRLNYLHSLLGRHCPDKFVEKEQPKQQPIKFYGLKDFKHALEMRSRGCYFEGDNSDIDDVVSRLDTEIKSRKNTVAKPTYRKPRKKDWDPDDSDRTYLRQDFEKLTKRFMTERDVRMVYETDGPIWMELTAPEILEFLTRRAGRTPFEGERYLYTKVLYYLTGGKLPNHKKILKNKKRIDTLKGKIEADIMECLSGNSSKSERLKPHPILTFDQLITIDEASKYTIDQATQKPLVTYPYIWRLMKNGKVLQKKKKNTGNEPRLVICYEVMNYIQELMNSPRNWIENDISGTKYYSRNRFYILNRLKCLYASRNLALWTKNSETIVKKLDNHILDFKG